MLGAAFLYKIVLHSVSIDGTKTAPKMLVKLTKGRCHHRSGLHLQGKGLRKIYLSR